ncbi:MAG: hypothetical protein ACYCV4_05445 [Dermatophilaceae bacterium]
MKEGVDYLPHSWQEAAIWLGLILVGATLSRCVVVFSHHHAVAKGWS